MGGNPCNPRAGNLGGRWSFVEVLGWSLPRSVEVKCRPVRSSAWSPQSEDISYLRSVQSAVW